MAPYQKTNASCCAYCALAFAGATAQQPSFKRACRAEAAEQRRLVGLGRLELPTSRLSSARSNQLSYKPLTLFLKKVSGPAHAQPGKFFPVGICSPFTSDSNFVGAGCRAPSELSWFFEIC